MSVIGYVVVTAEASVTRAPENAHLDEEKTTVNAVGEVTR